MNPSRYSSLLVVPGAALALTACSDEGSVGAGGSAVEDPFDGRSIVALIEPGGNQSATDLAFNPEREEELWVTVRPPYDETLLCTEDSEPSACSQLVGSVLIFADATVDNPSAEFITDPNGWHFMRRVPAIDFGPGDTFGTCGEARTGNWEDTAPDYIGPTLWSSDPEIFAQLISETANGSHLDMLHSSPYCVGIAHERENAYWVVNGQSGSLDRYDFKAPHEPGGEDHSDGEITRYVPGALTRVPNIPGHLVIDHGSNTLFAVDTGGQRVVSLDITAGERGDPFPANDPVPVHHMMTGVELTEVVAPGILQQPSGIALHPDGLLVTDNLTSQIHLFGRAGSLLHTYDTGLPEGSLAGIVVGPDERIYFTDLLMSRVFRLE